MSTVQADPALWPLPIRGPPVTAGFTFSSKILFLLSILFPVHIIILSIDSNKSALIYFCIE